MHKTTERCHVRRTIKNEVRERERESGREKRQIGMNVPDYDRLISHEFEIVGREDNET